MGRTLALAEPRNWQNLDTNANDRDSHFYSSILERTFPYQWQARDRRRGADRAPESVDEPDQPPDSSGPGTSATRANCIATIFSA